LSFVFVLLASNVRVNQGVDSSSDQESSPMKTQSPKGRSLRPEGRKCEAEAEGGVGFLGTGCKLPQRGSKRSPDRSRVLEASVAQKIANSLRHVV